MKDIVIVLSTVALMATTQCSSSVEDVSPTDIVINEVFVKSADAGNDDWVELYNKGDDAVDLTGWALKDAKERQPYRFAGTRLEAGDYLVVSRDETATAGFGFGLGNADMVRLYDASGELVDRVEWEDNTELEDKTLGRYPDGAEELTILETPTPDAANEQ